MTDEERGGRRRQDTGERLGAIGVAGHAVLAGQGGLEALPECRIAVDEGHGGSGLHRATLGRADRGGRDRQAFDEARQAGGGDLWTNRLRQVVRHAGGHDPAHPVVLAHAGQHDDRHGPQVGRGPHGREHLFAIQEGHLEVEQHEVERLTAEELEPLKTVLSLHRRGSKVADEDAHEQSPRQRVVVYNEYTHPDILSPLDLAVIQGRVHPLPTKSARPVEA